MDGTTVFRRPVAFVHLRGTSRWRPARSGRFLRFLAEGTSPEGSPSTVGSWPLLRCGSTAQPSWSWVQSKFPKFGWFVAENLQETRDSTWFYQCSGFLLFHSMLGMSGPHLNQANQEEVHELWPTQLQRDSNLQVEPRWASPWSQGHQMHESKTEHPQVPSKIWIVVLKRIRFKCKAIYWLMVSPISNIG